ncbi:NADH:flavin oxidoreductase/NADH oxidase family protein [Alkalicoccus halolimnae]|uniref:NADH:flavin oxidoreductase/NADH oxidase family protein n=1 Tax=Alkalicoccus halolimnae TaxID=1667239 RepID=A0A5C7F132_9BACI|nr:NADH:flavin oxidoreductase/NADH oxidase family protein [Alkalicoccus halolimnae]TXF83264.1 NADH:flavin oxidoreductase/NADH oxidase family protein [Alkalicoccus halolimnae]
MKEHRLLAQPFTFKNKGMIKNRLVKSAMSEGMATKDHLPTKEILRLYEAWARGGTGLIITGNVMINDKALGEPGNIVLADDDHIDLFKRWAKAGTSNDTHLWMQVNHPGKQVLKGVSAEAVAPSAVPFPPKLQRFFPEARALEEEEIEQTIREFAGTAALAERAGFTGVQIHAAHGYLISQFLSPRHNQRTDKWGGSLENRFRFLSEIYQAIRSKTGGEFFVGVKINSSDFMKAGFSEEDSRFVIKELERLGVDLIEISGGTYEKAVLLGKDVKPSTLKREAYFLEYAEQLKRETTIPIVLTGGFRTRTTMEEALQAGATDFIGIARPSAVNPAFANDLLSGKEKTLTIKPIKTGLPFIDNKGLLEITWYSQQLTRIGKGKPVKPGFPPILSLLLTLLQNGREVFQKRRV